MEHGRMKDLLAALALSTALAGCATTDPGQQPTAALDTVDERRVAALRDGERVGLDQGQPKLICKAISVTGSRNLRRVCHRREEWMSMRRNGEETARSSHREGTMQGTPAATWVDSGEKSGAGLAPGS